METNKKILFLSFFSFVLLFCVSSVLYSAPNSLVNPVSPPVTDQNNASVALSEAAPGEVYSLFNNFLAAGAITPSVVNWSYSLAGGAPGTWVEAVKAPDAPYVEEWNPWISAMTAPAGGYIMVSSERMAGPPFVGMANGIVANLSPGGGAPPAGAPAFVAANIPGAGGTWLDYPVVEIDDDIFSPGAGNAHMVWTEFIDATGGDTDGNANLFDDPGDAFTIWYAGSNTIGAAPIYPATTIPIPITGILPQMANSMSSHKPGLDVVGAGGTPAIPPGGVYVGYFDPGTAIVFIDASPAPVAGVPFGALTGGLGPVPVAPAIPIPPVSAAGTNISMSVTVAVSNSPVCPGAVYVAWTDLVTGDPDIMFASSFDGGITWTPLVRVNQDPVGNGLEQWAPHMRVDDATGHIYITYYDKRNDPLNVLTETWSSVSTDCGVTWTDCVVSLAGPTPPISNVPMVPTLSVGEYLGSDINILNGMAFVWNDASNGADQDVFFDFTNNCMLDTDGDGVPDITDNCPLIPNPGQTDSDGDGYGDVCDICPGFNDNIDTDADGIPDGCDNCPTLPNPGQIDSDGDGYGDVCDICPGFNDNVDSDADGFPDGCDICPGFNDNVDSDFDGVPDGCDICPGFDDTVDTDADGFPDGCDICPGFDDNVDTDSDGVPDGCDNCPTLSNSTQTDSDGDGVGDVCDICPGFDDNLDTDSDGVPDSCDNCPAVSNPLQTDANMNGIGDACEGCCIGIRGNVDGDLLEIVDISDLVYLVDFMFTSGPAPPCTQEGNVEGDILDIIDISDLVYLVDFMFTAGPPPPACP